MSMFVNEEGIRLTEIPKDYSDGMTKQSFKDSTDINKIIKKGQVTDGMSHALKYDPSVYGEFTGVDLLSAYEQLNRAQAIFDDLPSEVRKEFQNDAFKFAAYASDPANIERLDKLIPAIAEPGRFFPKPGDEPVRVEVVTREPEPGDPPAPGGEPPATPPSAPEPPPAAPASSGT